MKKFLWTLFIPILFAVFSSAAQVKKSAAKPATKSAPKATAKEITTPSGLKYVDLVAGTGAVAHEGQTVVVNYTGTLTNGRCSILRSARNRSSSISERAR